ncbi:protein ZINC INDUCED FACILITATOR-LIKE 1-like [Magnolia sinica]|uniref:protein ZINC INDUCED FACILITATOR-LIKE 1-like n=1 Tax=Magnolia sinica TaxID=86752 RepID=UPI00265A6A67|nr:protein ZINC INDUCED FACILITATOR-LIKE 1-like [Magnolia sinica]
MGDRREPLLKKNQVYYENCPGCKLDRINETRTGIPLKEFIYVWIAALCSSLPVSSLFPFLYFMIRDFHIAKEQDIGFYVGCVGAAFMLGRAFTSVLWGVVADRYGRKPVVLLGVLSVIVFNTLFGLSLNFWMAISTRFLLGCFNGILGPIKAYASEVGHREHQALGLSIVSTSWGIGLIIGPAIGGFLAQPAEKYPNLFSKDSLFGRFPYFLPCLCISFFAVIVLIACFWLPETLHMHRGKNKEEKNTNEALEASSHGNRVKESVEEGAADGKGPASKDKSLFLNWPLMSSIIVYCVFSLHDMAYTEIFSLWAVSDRKYGGLSYSSQDVGTVLAFSGCGLLLFQLFLYPMVEKILGPIMVSRLAGIISIPLLSSYPLIALLSGISLSIVLNFASLLKNVFSVTIVTGIFLLQNNAVPQHQRGAANGLSMTIMSIFKAIGPAAGGALFAWAQKHQDSMFLPGDQIVFFVLNVVMLAGVILTFKPFLAQA